MSSYLVIIVVYGTNAKETAIFLLFVPLRITVHLHKDVAQWSPMDHGSGSWRGQIVTHSRATD